MLIIAKLLGKSPFSPLQIHMDKVANCIEELPSLFSAFTQGDRASLETAAKAISKLEHEADLTKNDIRNHLPKSVFLPIARASFLEILSLQDAIADQVEDIATVLTLKPVEKTAPFFNMLNQFVEKNAAVFWLVHQVVKQLNDLVAVSFGGVEAQKVKKTIEDIAYKEHEVDLMQCDFLKQLFHVADDMTHSHFYLWRKIFQEVAALSNLSEKLANRIRMILELK